MIVKLVTDMETGGMEERYWDLSVGLGLTIDATSVRCFSQGVASESNLLLASSISILFSFFDFTWAVIPLDT